MADHEHKEEHKEHEHKEHEHKEKKDKMTIKKSTLTLVSVGIIMLIIGVAAGYVYAGTFSKNPSPIANVQVPGDVAPKVVDYLNNNAVQPGTNLSLVSAQEENGLYKITVLYQGKQIPVYTDSTGNMLFLSQPLLLNETLQQPSQDSGAGSGNIPKTDVPKTELYVMSFCPYGVQAENAMKPVVDLMGSKAPVKVRFIVNINGNTTDSVQSLHGPNEAAEDLRQVCIMKYYPNQYWSYVSTFNQNCNSKLSDAAGLDTCWKSVAGNLSFDVSKISTCSKGQEGLSLLAVDEQLSSQYGVTGSPTLRINDAVYNGQRTPAAFQSAICSGFNSPPAECSQTVNSTGVASGASTGGCGT